MPKRGKKYLEALKLIDKGRLYDDLHEAIELAKKVSYVNFDATLDVAFHLNVDPRKPDQQLRGSISLPHGTGKKVIVAAFATGEKAKEAEEAGADIVGAEDLIEKIKKGFLDFDATVATPDMMRHLGKIGRILGPRGLMPSPKTGTVTMEIGKAIKALKAGKISFRVDRTGNVHTIAGKLSFDTEKLIDNLKAIFETIVKMRPSTVKGQYIKSVTISPTMGPSIPLDVNYVISLVK